MIADYGGLAKVMPLYAMLFMIITMASIGLPTLNGFIGEFTILIGAFNRSMVWACSPPPASCSAPRTCCGCTSGCSSARSPTRRTRRCKDLTLREQWTLIPLIVMCFWIGLYPKPFFRIMEPSVERVVQRGRPRLPAPAGRAPTPAAPPPRRRPRRSRPPARGSADGVADLVALLPEIVLAPLGDGRAPRSGVSRSAAATGALGCARGRPRLAVTGVAPVGFGRHRRPAARFFFGMLVVDQLRAILQGRCSCSPALAPALARLPRAQRLGRRRVLRAGPVRHPRHDGHGLGRQPGQPSTSASS